MKIEYPFQTEAETESIKIKSVMTYLFLSKNI